MMRNLSPFLSFCFGLLLICSSCRGQETQAHILSYDPQVGSPKAQLDDLKWMAGHWRGEAFGGITEEIWAPPLGGSMLGAFKLVNDGKVTFYEIETISQEEKTLILRLKHFHANLKGWEEKDQTEDFRLVKMTPNAAYFDGFTIERVSENEMNMYVVIEEKDGKAEEVKFNYRRWDGQ